MYSGRWCFADQLHVSALYIVHHTVGIINLIGDYINVFGYLWVGGDEISSYSSGCCNHWVVV